MNALQNVNRCPTAELIIKTPSSHLHVQSAVHHHDLPAPLFQGALRLLDDYSVSRLDHDLVRLTPVSPRRLPVSGRERALKTTFNTFGWSHVLTARRTCLVQIRIAGGHKYASCLA